MNISTPSILGLGTTVPEFCVSQEAYVRFTQQALNLPERRATFVQNIVMRSAIKQRHFVIKDPLLNRSEWTFLPQGYPLSIPTMTQRNALYKLEAPKLSHRAAERALNDWGGDKKNITHVISVSCTGMMAPGLEFLLIDSLGLSRNVQRLGINMMGCFGALRGLEVAKALAAGNTENRVLMVCTELCSLHLQADTVPHALISNAIFADGAAAVVVGSQPLSHENPLWRLERYRAQALENSLGDMTWEVSDHGFLMYLSAQVPSLLRACIKDFAQILLGDISFAECAWPVHPGGKAILEGIESTCALEPWQTKASWETLAQYGNMSSATFLFVLDKLKAQNAQYQWAVGLAFGPGLSVEGILLQKP